MNNADRYFPVPLDSFSYHVNMYTVLSYQKCHAMKCYNVACLYLSTTLYLRSNCKRMRFTLTLKADSI